MYLPVRRLTRIAGGSGRSCPARTGWGTRSSGMSSRFCAVSSQPANENSGSDLILPCQYYDISGGHRLTGEQRLMLALLTDAINVYQQGVVSRSTRKRMLYVDAERCIMAGPMSR